MMNKVNDASLLHQQIKPKTIVVHSDLRLKLLSWWTLVDVRPSEVTLKAVSALLNLFIRDQRWMALINGILKWRSTAIN